jgi:hypothetical protein
MKANLRTPALQELTAQHIELQQVVWIATLLPSTEVPKRQFLVQLKKPKVFVIASLVQLFGNTMTYSKNESVT